MSDSNTKATRRMARAAWLGSFALLFAGAVCFSGCGAGMAAMAVEQQKKERKDKKKKKQKNALLAGAAGDTARVYSSTQTRLQWSPPTTRVNGAPLGSDLAGYKLYRGPRSRYYDTVVDLPNPLTTQYVFDTLDPGTYYFAVSAYDNGGLESGYSNEATKMIQ